MIKKIIRTLVKEAVKEEMKEWEDNLAKSVAIAIKMASHFSITDDSREKKKSDHDN
jgi:chorismate mutase